MFNENKRKFMIRYGTPSPEIEIKIENAEIGPVSVFKQLGAIVNPITAEEEEEIKEGKNWK
jgi:hypothetical protein